MNIPLQTLLFIVLALASRPLLGADPGFDSGSNGSYGALNITENTTLDLPPDGILHCTTIKVALSGTLRFNRNPLNTPVYLLAQGDVEVDGTIDVSGENTLGVEGGKGGPGGFDGGDGGVGGTGFGGNGTGGDGHGPGGGSATLRGRIHGVFGNRADENSNTYGNALLSPLIGGSGGAGGRDTGGGGGGGAILIASSTRITIGQRGVVKSWGGTANFFLGSGSGGAVRFVAPIVTGTGTVDTGGGAQGLNAGRTRIDCLDGQAVRTLNAFRTASSRGSQMFVFPAGVPRLEITEAAGQVIAAPATGPVNIQLAQGAPTNHVVKVQASGFTNATPIRVVIIPARDFPPVSYDVELPKSDAGPVTVSVDVIIPADATSHIYAWTR